MRTPQLVVGLRVPAALPGANQMALEAVEQFLAGPPRQSQRSRVVHLEELPHGHQRRVRHEERRPEAETPVTVLAKELDRLIGVVIVLEEAGVGTAGRPAFDPSAPPWSRRNSARVLLSRRAREVALVQPVIESVPAGSHRRSASCRWRRWRSRARAKKWPTVLASAGSASARMRAPWVWAYCPVMREPREGTHTGAWQ